MVSSMNQYFLRRIPWSRTATVPSTLLLCLGMILSTALICLAAEPSFWIGLGIVQSQPIGQGSDAGKLMWIPIVVGSDEGGNLQTHTVSVRLTVNGPAGFACTAAKAFTGKFHPSVTMPIRFQVTYTAAQNTAGNKLPGPTKVPLSRYNVLAEITEVTPSHVHLNNSQVSQPFDLPAGGTRACWTPPD